MSKRLFATTLAAALSLALGAASFAADAKKEAKTVTGKSGCATCEGVTADEHAILLLAKDGTRWVLTAEKDSEAYKKAHKVRQEGKEMVATLAGEPKTKKGEDGKEFKEAKISDIKVKESKES